MQMKVVVHTPENFKKWMATQATLIQKVKDQDAQAAAEGVAKVETTGDNSLVGENNAPVGTQPETNK
jgi:heme/copper-type cytochrome/quinol oxidase subunit 2